MSPFRITATETVAEVSFLRIDRRTIAADSGEEHERTVVHHPGAVVIVPVDGRDALLVRQYRAAVDGELLEVPAGKRDVDGEAPEDTARRELAEEIGIVPDRLVPLAEFYNSPGFCDEYTYLYAAFDLESVAAPAPVGPEEEAMHVERVPLAEVPNLVARRRIVDAKSIVGLLLTRAYLEGTYGGLEA